LIYPIATIFAIWAISGHVGPAEAALRLAPNLQGWRRGIAGTLFVVTTAAALPAVRTTGWKSFVWLVFAACVIAVAVGADVVGVAVGVAVGVDAVGIAAVIAGVAVSGSILVALVVMFVVASAAANVGAGAMTGVFAVAVPVLWATTTTRGWRGPLLSLCVAAMIAASWLAAWWLSSVDRWEFAGPLLLFLGLLTLLNAPFDCSPSV